MAKTKEQVQAELEAAASAANLTPQEYIHSLGMSAKEYFEQNMA